MSDEELHNYRLKALEDSMREMQALMARYQRNIMYAVIGGGALANSPLLAQIAKGFVAP